MDFCYSTYRIVLVDNQNNLQLVVIEQYLIWVFQRLAALNAIH